MNNIKRTASLIARKIFEKKGKIFSEIMSEWDNIVGEGFSVKCYPQKVCSISNNEEKINVLHVMCDSVITSFEMEFKKETILERIAVYFGFKIIHQIKTKIMLNR